MILELARMTKLIFALLVCMSEAALAQVPPQFPTRAIHLIVPFPPGGGNDTVARAIAAGDQPAARPAGGHRQPAGRVGELRDAVLELEELGDAAKLAALLVQ